MEIAVGEPHLRAQGENGYGNRPNAERSAVHGQSEQGQDASECENDFSHGRPLNAPRPLPVSE